MNCLTLFWLTKSVQWIFEISAHDVITADYTTIMSRTLTLMGNHVIYDHSAWFLRVIMWSSCSLCSLPSVKEQTDEILIKVLVRIVSLSLQLHVITPTWTLIILNITKTSSNNCLKFAINCLLFCLKYREVMAVPGPPLSEQDARKYFIDVVLGIEYCKSRSNHSQYY